MTQNDDQLYEPTGMQSFTFCPWKYYLQKIKKLVPAYVSPAMIRGKIGHDVLHQGFDHFDVIFDAAIAHYTSDRLTEAKVPLSLETDEIDKMRDDLRVICQNTLLIAESKGIKFLEQEKKMEFVVRYKGEAYDFKGTPDVICRFPDTPDDYVEIIDWKFGRKQPDAQLNRNIQHGLYFYMLRQNGYKVWRNWWVAVGEFLPYKRDGKTAKKGELRGPGFYPITIQDQDMAYVIEQVGRICTQIEAGEFTQHAYGPNAPCSYCEFEGSIECPTFQIGSIPTMEDS